MTHPIPMLDLAAQTDPIRDQIKAAVAEVIDSHKFILGPDVSAFEKELADYLDVAHAVSCANGSDALVLALKALGVGPGDEVITTTFSFFATAGAVARCGATPVFADIDPVSFNIDPDAVEAKISAKTKVIMPVHLYGQMTPMEPLMVVAKTHGLRVVEDAAQAIGAKENGRAAATIGDAGTLSFFPAKNLGAFGDAGMVTTKDVSVAERLRSLRVHGTGRVRYHYDHVGLNSRMDTIQAAVLRVKLPHLEGWSEGRRTNAAKYDERLAGLPGITTPTTTTGMTHIYNQYTLRVRDRAALQARLEADGIAAAVYYPMPLHLQDCFADLRGKVGDCPVAEKAAREVLSIPVHADLTEADIDRICAVIREHAQELAAISDAE